MIDVPIYLSTYSQDLAVELIIVVMANYEKIKDEVVSSEHKEKPNNLTAEQLAEMNTSDQGLTSSEAARRLERDG